MTSAQQQAIPAIETINDDPPFTKGPLIKHITVMAFTSAAGLIGLFASGILNLFYIGLTEKTELMAALGFADVLMSIQIAIGIGLMIATSSVISVAVGKKHLEQARILAFVVYVSAAAVGIVIAILGIIFLEPTLALIGADEATAALAYEYLVIMYPSMPLFTVAMAIMGAQRGIGDALGSTLVLLSSVVTIAIGDTIFVWWLDMELVGAAIAGTISRVILLLFGIYVAIHKKGLFALPPMRNFMRVFWSGNRRVWTVAAPVIVTQSAAPVTIGILLVIVADFGTDAVAAMGAIGRIFPVCFALVFSLSSAVGPIIGQNLGAREYDRLSVTLREALIFALVVTGTVCLFLTLVGNFVGDFFATNEITADYIEFWATRVIWLYLFFGGLFISSSVLNTIGNPIAATILGWSRAIIILPVFYLFEPQKFEDVILTWAAVESVIGFIAILVAYRALSRVISDGKKAHPHPAKHAAG